MQNNEQIQVARELGLRDEEYQRILDILQRPPTPTELAMFSVEWSEHCGYPHSRRWFELFPREGKFPVLVGEDAGGIVYQGQAVVFKMESHNHPSQVEPRQGAATGIGGIIRDIFGSGARPIACLDSLHFGPLDSARSNFIFKGVVDGIAFYGNCVGVPTVAGELYFHPSYQGNCLVNVMSIGIASQDRLAKSWAKGKGNLIIYAGNRTGRDGIGGCSILASQEFSGQDEKRPSVQIGDPFTEKCLIEATMEALTTGFLVGIKDMGAAGLTCSSSEMAAAGKSGIKIYLDRIPVREEAMEPWEIMMSESQERMLLCVKRGYEDSVLQIFHKWGLEAVVVGEVVDGDKITIELNGQIVADIPAQELTKPPVYTPPAEKPAYLERINRYDWDDLPLPHNWNEVLLQLMGSPNLCSRHSVFEQYDHMVQINTSILPGTGTVVLRVKNLPWGIAVTTDCNPVFCYLDPYQGAQIAVAEAARNLAACGAQPAGITDCLNFGNPQKPDRYWQFIQAVQGISDACKFFDLPVVSGNVSFYNESPTGPIHPTPTIGMIGIIEDVQTAVNAAFKEYDDVIVLLGETQNEIGGSEYLRVIHQQEFGPAPQIDLPAEKNLQEFLIDAVRQGLVQSSTDLSEGGLACALGEGCICGQEKKGCLIDIGNLPQIRLDALLFGESCGRALITCKLEKLATLEKLARIKTIPFFVIGKVTGKSLTIYNNQQSLISVSIEDLWKAWYRTL